MEISDDRNQIAGRRQFIKTVGAVIATASVVAIVGEGVNIRRDINETDRVYQEELKLQKPLENDPRYLGMTKQQEDMRANINEMSKKIDELQKEKDKQSSALIPPDLTKRHEDLNNKFMKEIHGSLGALAGLMVGGLVIVDQRGKQRIEKQKKMLLVD